MGGKRDERGGRGEGGKRSDPGEREREEVGGGEILLFIYLRSRSSDGVRLGALEASFQRSRA